MSEEHPVYPYRPVDGLCRCPECCSRQMAIMLTAAFSRVRERFIKRHADMTDLTTKQIDEKFIAWVESFIHAAPRN